MTELRASRTVVKSPPELWAECSDAASLARHLGQFGDIRITRLEPETAIAWEGDRARGTVRIEPAGWGTKVILTAVADRGAPDPLPPAADAVVPAEDSSPPPQDAPPPPPDAPPPRPRRFTRLLAFLRGRPPSAEAEPPPTVDAEPQSSGVPEPPAGDAPASDTEAVLAAALDSLGQAHHRPFSRG